MIILKFRKLDVGSTQGWHFDKVISCMPEYPLVVIWLESVVSNALIYDDLGAL